MKKQWIEKCLKIARCRSKLDDAILELWNVLPVTDRTFRKFENFRKELWKMDLNREMIEENTHEMT